MPASATCEQAATRRRSFSLRLDVLNLMVSSLMSQSKYLSGVQLADGEHPTICVVDVFVGLPRFAHCLLCTAVFSSGANKSVSWAVPTLCHSVQHPCC